MNYSLHKLAILSILLILVVNMCWALSKPQANLNEGDVLSAAWLNSMFDTIYNWATFRDGIPQANVSASGTVGLAGFPIPGTTASGAFYIIAHCATGPTAIIAATKSVSASAGLIVILSEEPNATGSYMTFDWPASDSIRCFTPASETARFLINGL